MLITNHVLTGALVGTVAPGVPAAFAAGVASHVALDVVPHWGDDERFLAVAVPDGVVGLTAMAVVAATCPASLRTRVVAGMLGACLPDADKPSRLFFGASPFPAVVDAYHVRIQNESPRRLPQEVVVAAASAWILRRAWRRLRPRS